MTTLREAAQQALEALEEYQSKGAPFMACDGAVAALRAALAQQAEPVQEPVAWIYQNMYTEQEYLVWKKGTGGRNWTPLYAAPPRCPNCASLEAQNTELDLRLAEMEQAYENGYKAGVAAEREECAKVCDFHVARLSAIDEPRPALAVGICAAAIRARGNT